MRSWVAHIRDLFRDDPWGMVARCTAALAVLALLLFTWQAVTAARALNEAQQTAHSLADAIAAGDVPRARVELATFNDATSRAHHRTDGPLWWLGARIPFLGPNLAAVSTIAGQSDAIADDALPRIVAVADQVQLETFRPKNGRINLAAVAKALPVLATTDRVLARADAKVSSIQTDRLVGLLQSPVSTFQQRTHAAAVGAAAAHDAGLMLPKMLGGDGKTRRYLLLVLNNAEIRSIDGMPGSFAVLEARRGKLAMREQAGNTEMKPLKKPLLNVHPETQAGFEVNVGRDIRDAAIVPHFPRVAALASSIAGDHWDKKFDGVVAIDPVALGYVLGAVGQVDIGGGMFVNQSNAASTLMNGIYLRFPKDPAAQDDAFERAARRSFDALTGGGGNSVQAIRALVRGVEERRLFLWSRHNAEQARIRSTGIAGDLTDDRALARPQIGVFLTDTTQAKMDYYLRSGTHVVATKCYGDGTQDLRLTTTIRSDAPQGAQLLPDSIVGLGNAIHRGQTGLNIRLVAPPKGSIQSVTVDGRRAPVGETTYRGRQLTRIDRILGPGESTLIVTQMRSGPRASGTPMLWSTPGVLPNDDVVSASACS
ncbi:MAG: DUF4012 domain-containing protein [Aeromicrobium sp.]